MEAIPGLHAFVHPLPESVAPAAPGRLVALAAPGAAAEGAAWRAALLARDRRASLHLLAHAVDDRWLDLARAQLQDTAARLQAHFALQVTLGQRRGRLGEHDVCAAQDGGLVVVAAPQGRTLERAVGSVQERLARRSGAPVLLVRRPARASYRRVVAAARSPQDAVPVIQAASQLSRDPRMTVLHVAAPDARNAMEHLAALIGAAGVDRDAAVPVVRSGEPGREILRQVEAEQAQLLALGVRQRARWRTWIPGLLRRVLHATAADVLLVPVE